MTNIRDIKHRARADLHKRASMPAYYFAAKGDPGTFQQVTVRVHTSFAALGIVAIGGVNSELMDVAPRIVFLRDEVALPAKQSVVMISADEGYKVSVALPPDGITITATAARLKDDELALYPYPGKPASEPSTEEVP